MAPELEQIISNRETLKESIHAEKLMKLRAYPETGALRLMLRGKQQVKKLHMLGGISDPAMDGQFSSYRSDQGNHVLLLNPPEDFSVRVIPEKELTELDVRFTSIEELDLSAMTKLVRLNLSNNRYLKQVTGWDGFQSLKELDLHNTQLEDLERIGACSRLRSLDASGLKLDVPRFLTRLSNLNSLNLSRSRIVQLPNLRKLTNLKSLDLRGALLPSVIESDFPDSLESVLLADSTLVRIPEKLRELPNLRCLDLSGLHLKALPDWLADLGLEFTTGGSSGIILRGTVIEGIDMSIFEQPQEIIRQWFRERRADDRMVPMNEVKVVFLGDGDAGKSMTIDRLMHNGALPLDYDGNASTGIATHQKVYDLEGREVTVHFWDFGGMEILHSLHRMFLTERTIYVLLVSVRENVHNDRIRYWLHTLKSFAGNSPVLLALTKIDTNPGARIDEQEIRGFYPNLKDIVRMSALRDTPEAFNSNFTNVLLRLISEHSALNTMLPASWQQLRRRIADLPGDHISRREFEGLCDACAVSKDRQTRKSLLSWFHDLGFCFHHRGSSVQDPYIILRPDWVSHALSKILLRVERQSVNGLVFQVSIRDCLCRPDESGHFYEPADAEYILSLMREYRLSFKWSDELEFIPSLCGLSALPVADEYHHDRTVSRYRLEYDYLPHQLLYQLMVELSDVLDISNVWASGAQFVWQGSGTSALVECVGNALDIYIRAHDPDEVRNCLAVIRDVLGKIQQDSQIQAGKLRVRYRRGDQSEWFSYDALTAMQASGMGKIYSEELSSMIPIAEILGYADDLQGEEQERFVTRLASICEKIQSNRSLWGAGEDALNTYLLHMLSMQGYSVQETMLEGRYGMGSCLDIRLASAMDTHWARGGTFAVRGSGKQQRIEWNIRFNELVRHSMKSAAPIVFTVTYAACKAEEFPYLISKYAEDLRYYTPYDDRFAPWETEELSLDTPMSFGIRSIYERGSQRVTAYHFVIRIGFDEVLEQKLEQRLRTPNNEYKVVFLGDGEAGKSLTVARLHEPEMDIKTFDGEVTPGIDIRSRCYEVNGINVQVNFWDFGGQEILHSMHRLFLSKRTLYVVILNTRNDSQDERARFWLRYIDTYAPGAPVMLVLNKIDQNEHASINEPVLRRQFRNIEKVLRISALKWSQKEFQDEFIAHLEEHIRSVTVEESPLLKNERLVRDALCSWSDPRISIAEYEQLCVDQGITDADRQAALLKRLEHSGICVCFDGHSYTEQYRLLEPRWVTNAIYAILFNLHSQAQNGVIDHKTIQGLFQKDPKELKCVRRIRYKPDEVEFILRVMRSYRLSFEIPDQKKEFLPMLCPRKEALVLEKFLQERDLLEFHMCFEYLPSEILYQFMVARQTELDLGQESIWLTGAMLTDSSGCRAAVVKENDTLKFYISRSHDLPHARSYMDSLRHDMELIIRKNGLRTPETRVVYRYQGEEELFDYERLILSERCGVLSTVSKKLEKSVAIRDILDQTYRSEQLQHQALFRSLVRACQILQDNYDNWGKSEPVLNRCLRDLLRAMGYQVMDQPESGASATGEAPGRPDMIVNMKDSASSVLIEPLRITGVGNADRENWDAHLSKMVNNYNSGGYRMMVLVSYVTCSQKYFPKVDKFYHDRMCRKAPKGGIGLPEHFEWIKDKGMPDMIRVTRADYYTRGYSPTIYHFLVHIPKIGKASD